MLRTPHPERSEGSLGLVKFKGFLTLALLGSK